MLTFLGLSNQLHVSFRRQPSTQCFTAIQGLLLVSINIILLLKTESNKVEILYSQNNLQHLVFVREAYCTFSFNTELFYRCRIKRALEARGVAWWASCIRASRDLGSRSRADYQSAFSKIAVALWIQVQQYVFILKQFMDSQLFLYWRCKS